MKKVLSCILSFVPGILFFITLISIVLISMVFSDPMSTFETLIALLMVAVAFLAVIACYAVMILYIVKAFKNPNLSTGMKVLWCVLLYCFNIFVFPVFWFMYLKND